MKFFFRRKDDPVKDDDSKGYRERDYIALSGREYNLYQDRDATIKIWLPDTARKTITQICDYLDTTASDFLRQILFVHMYGRADFLGLLQMEHASATNRKVTTEEESYAHAYANSKIRFSRAKTPQEKPPPKVNTASYKVWVPSRLKTDLERLALSERESLSSYARNVILEHLYGRIPHTKSPFYACPPEDADEG